MQSTFYDTERSQLEDSVELTRMSLCEYGARYSHWAVAYSGGKDSSACVTVVARMIEAGDVPKPKTLTVLYADTRLELLPLQASAMGVLAALRERGITTRVVLPAMDERFFVYMFGRGVPAPKNRFRWCTPQMKIKPMMAALADLRKEHGEKFLMLTGVRVGESAQRDARIALSCGKDGAECGQGWFQEATPESVADTLAPLLHWRVCHVWDWLTFHAPSYGFPTETVAEAYGGDEALEVNARTGCVGCNLASRDVALDMVIALPQWSYLAPLKRLKPLYAELIKPKHRLRKDGSEVRADGSLVCNPMRLGPYTMDARMYGLRTVIEIEDEINAEAEMRGRPKISLINAEEMARILELISLNTWPNGWEGTEPTGAELLPEVLPDGRVQTVLFGA